MNSIINDIVKNKKNKDIVILGKGPSVDSVDVSHLSNFIVINTNDSEIIFPGDIGVFHQGWVLDIFDSTPPRCKLYITDRIIPGDVCQLQVEYVPYTPDSVELLLDRFFSNIIYVERAILITALRVANEIGGNEVDRKNVYLLGFDFTTKLGYTNKIQNANRHDEPAIAERLIESQEKLLNLLLEERHRLSINIFHVGNKSYSSHTSTAFKKVLSGERRGTGQAAPRKESTANDIPRVKIVAEITTNHFGDMDRLAAMIIKAKEAGADYIKLQKRDVDSFYSSEKLESRYNSPFGKTFRDYRMGIELTRGQFDNVAQLCREIDIGWFASILDLPSFEFIQDYQPELIKLPSTISEHKEFIAAVSERHMKDVVISTGFTDSNYEDFILKSFKNAGTIYLLQCTSAYPTPNEDAHIGVIRHYYNLSKNFKNLIPGYSSHDIGSLCSMLAVAAGALMIEKHVNFGDVTWSHFDQVSINLVNGDFAQFVADIRCAEIIIGSENKIIHDTEYHKYWLSNSGHGFNSEV